MSRPVRSLLAVVAALGISTAGASFTDPPVRAAAAPVQGGSATGVGTPGSGAPPASVPVHSAVAVCPGLLSDEADPLAGLHHSGSTTVTALSPPSAAAGDAAAAPADGRGTLRELGGTAARLSATLRPASLASADLPPGQSVVVARASGALAPGLTVTQTSEARSGLARGLAGTTCTAPGTSQWFVGTGAQVGKQSRLVLTDADPGPALLDLALYGPEGQLHPAGARDLSVPAGGRRVIDLDALAPDQRVLAVHVATRAGRVSAALRDEHVIGATGAGTDFLPAAAAPATSLVLPGVPEGGGARTLVLLAPGRAGASVQLQLVGTGGTFTPAGLQQVDLDPGVVHTLDLAAAAAGEAVAVRIEADRPVLAGLQVTRAGTRSDAGFLAAAPPLTGPTALTDAVGGPGQETRLYLTAPRQEAAVDLTTVTGGGAAPGSERVLVGAGRTVTLAVNPPTPSGRFAVVVTPRAGSGPVYAARMLTLTTGDGPLFTTAPLVTQALTVSVPVVTRDPG